MTRKGISTLRAHRAAISHGQPAPKTTLTQAIQAFCADCMGEYKDGITDCQNSNCPLYPHNTYNPNRVKSRKGHPDPKWLKQPLKE